MNEKITQAFIDSLAALVPDGWRAIDYRVPAHDEKYIAWTGAILTASSDPLNQYQHIIVEQIPLKPKPLTGLDFIAKLPQGTRVETKGGVYFRLITSFVRCDNEVYATWATSNKWSWHEGRKLADLSADTCEVYPSIVKPAPLTGKAWATVNLVTRPGSVFKYEDQIWCVILNGSRIEFGLTDRCFGDFIVWNDGKGWDDWSTELDSLSDKTVTWLYKAEIREKKENENE